MTRNAEIRALLLELLTYIWDDLNTDEENSALEADYRARIDALVPEPEPDPFPMERLSLTVPEGDLLALSISERGLCLTVPYRSMALPDGVFGRISWTQEDQTFEFPLYMVESVRFDRAFGRHGSAVIELAYRATAPSPPADGGEDT